MKYVFLSDFQSICNAILHRNNLLILKKRHSFLGLTLHTPSFLFAIAMIMLSFTAHSSTAQQKIFIDAELALKQGNNNKFKYYRNQLNDYPLSIYLDFKADINTLLLLNGNDFIAKANEYTNTPLFTPLHNKYLLNAGKKKRWNDFLIVSQKPPKNIRLQCYYYFAKFSSTPMPSEQFINEAKNLWLSGRSRPQQCDPLFVKLKQQGYLTDELIWKRMLLSFDSNQQYMLSLLANKMKKNRVETKTLQAVYKNPNTLLNLKINSSLSAKGQDIVVVGIKKLSKVNLNLAIDLYTQYMSESALNESNSHKLNEYLVKRILLKNDSNFIEHVDNMLPILRNDAFTEMRLRWAIKDNDMAALSQTLTYLSPGAKNKPRWQYWLANVNQLPTEEILEALSKQRNFYGFIAAQDLNQPINLAAIDHQQQDDLIPALLDNPTYKRVTEFMSLGRVHSARNEWRFLLNNADKQSQVQFAIIAKNNQWHDLGVQSTIYGKQWNHISVRFPFAHDAEFVDASQTYGVNVDEIMAIARRESAFHAYARSPVGARGLMQLMPKTAKQTARKNKLNYKKTYNLYDPELNIQLGSAYYAELLKKFDNNRVLATAAYNAGPHRVERWLRNTKNNIDVMAFIESIPFKETREYVQAVFSYRLIYEAQRGKEENRIFSKQEQAFLY